MDTQIVVSSRRAWSQRVHPQYTAAELAARVLEIYAAEQRRRRPGTVVAVSPAGEVVAYAATRSPDCVCACACQASRPDAGTIRDRSE